MQILRCFKARHGSIDFSRELDCSVVHNLEHQSHGLEAVCGLRIKGLSPIGMTLQEMLACFACHLSLSARIHPAFDAARAEKRPSSRIPRHKRDNSRRSRDETARSGQVHSDARKVPVGEHLIVQMRSLKNFNPSSHLLNEDRILPALPFPASIRLGLCKAVRCVADHTGRDSRYGAADGCHPISGVASLTWNAHTVRGAKCDPAKHSAKQGAYDADEKRVALGYMVRESTHATPCGSLITGEILA